MRCRLARSAGSHPASLHKQCLTGRRQIAAAALPRREVEVPNTTSHTQEIFSRRLALASLAASPLAFSVLPQPACAVQGLIAGRVPGLSAEPDEAGFYTYLRPEGKSGGHGVGWSEIPRYRFKVPEGWQETPVSIADLGGTEIDLRFSNKDQGDLSIVVAPVLRFADVGFGANVRLENLGTPDRIIAGFAPELFGQPLNEDDVLDTRVETDREGLTYYFWHVKPYKLVSATAVGNRLFLLTVKSNRRQWTKHEDKLRTIQDSFYVPAA